jgi:sugar fermentation stimulation protein A
LLCYPAWMTAGGPLFLTEPLHRARFIDRPNRFTVRFEDEARDGLAYLANPGRLGEILLPGTELLLAPRPLNRLPFEAVGACYQGRWPGDTPRVVFLNASRCNDLAERLLIRRLIPELAACRVVRREAREGGHRFDFLLSREDRPCLLEVKSVTLVEQGVAFFPDACTERGRRHLEELVSWSERKGCRAGVLFLVQGNAHSFLPDFHNDLNFARALARASGTVDILAYSLQPCLTEDGRIAVDGRPKPLSLPENALQAGLADSGVYMLVLHLPEATSLPVAALGDVRFKRGWYVYVGSAQRCLTRRLERHLRLRKNHHYHIDFLRQQAGWVRAFPVRGSDTAECRLAEEVRRISLGETRHFGSSDCRCPSHLFYFSEPPHLTPPFQELLVRLRHRPRGLEKI